MLVKLVLHNIAPDLFKSYFIRSSRVYSTRCNGLDILIPQVRTESAKKGTFNSGAQLLITCHPVCRKLTPFSDFS